MLKGFRDLNCWKQADDFRQQCFILCKEFPPDELYRLSDQLIRSSRGIGNALAEGHGRYHYQENIQFCRIARGSLEESLDHLIIANSCGYISREILLEMEQIYKEILRLLNGYISYLQKQKQKQAQNNKLTDPQFNQ